MSVNSVAVLRLMGKGGGAVPAGVNRGRGSVRGGRGMLIYLCVHVCKLFLYWQRC